MVVASPSVVPPRRSSVCRRRARVSLELRLNTRVEHRDLAFDRGGRGDGAGAALFRGADRGAAFSIRCRHFRRVKSGVQVSARASTCSVRWQLARVGCALSGAACYLDGA